MLWARITIGIHNRREFPDQVTLAINSADRYFNNLVITPRMNTCRFNVRDGKFYITHLGTFGGNLQKYRGRLNLTMVQNTTVVCNLRCPGSCHYTYQKC